MATDKFRIVADGFKMSTVESEWPLQVAAGWPWIGKNRKWMAQQ